MWATRDDEEHCRYKLTELPIYGMGREGMLMVADGQLNSVVPDTIYTRRVGKKLYELTDQFGSARMVISDRKLSDITGPMGAVGNFRADVVNYANVYPFGMEQPGRYLGSELYRYGYNGMEKDSSSGSERYTTYFRVYDPRVGRWLSVDPITQGWQSPYSSMDNNPIAVVDPTGAIGEGESNPLDFPGAKPTGSESEREGGSQRSDNTGTAMPPPRATPGYALMMLRQPEQHPEGEMGVSGTYGMGYWHNQVGGGGSWQTPAAYQTMVQGFVEGSISHPGSSAEDLGFRSDVQYSGHFYRLYDEVTTGELTGRPFVGGYHNPFFRGHGLYDNNGDLVLLFDGVLGVARLGIRGIAAVSGRLAARDALATRFGAGGGSNAVGRTGSAVGGQSVAEPTGQYYSVAFEMKLDRSLFGRSRSVHFNRANEALDGALQSDTYFASQMEQLIPGVQESVAKAGGRRTPTDWIWHHDQGEGVMQLVPQAQHTTGSIFWDNLHPGGKGGYSIWAIPNGAPPNR